MTTPPPQSPWQIPLVREIAAILLIKLVILLSIKAIWFTEPTVPTDGTHRFDAHLFQPATPTPITPTEETPR